MYSLLILGQIPGTGVTITFTMWALLSVALLLLALLAVIRRRRSVDSFRAIGSHVAPTIGSNDGNGFILAR